ncbi:MAG: four-carbon acid sugar kinase family protein [Pseudomonadota bacterium]
MPPLLTFYGDDFTGSTAVMEVLTFAGAPTMLFLEPPTPAMLSRYPDLRAIGVAGVARSRDPAWMKAHLPPVFEALKALKAPVVHYKVCSTFDSSPKIGSIGAAAEIGAAIFDSSWIPLVVGAPAIGRYQVFGALFAGAGDGVHRLDRHPVMSRHPVTPMDEADLRLHLSKQTTLPVGVVDMAAMKSGRADAALAHCLSEGARIIGLDTLDDETLAEAGRLIQPPDPAAAAAVFAIGSQGVEYALVAHWRTIGVLPATHSPPSVAPVDQLFCVSGSCAPTTAAQIACAEAKGFAIIPFDAAAAVDDDRLAGEREGVLSQCLTACSEGRDVLVTTVRGPDDPAIARMNNAIETAGAKTGEVNDRLGAALGALVAEIHKRTGLPRAVIGGGDTSGHALTALDAAALSAIAPLAPGAPLCRLHSSSAMDGFEVALKGGQMGPPEFFVQAKLGPSG